MDTNRIVIYNHDLSTATIEAQTEYCGFTVVKAEKGPAHPVRIPANSRSKIQDIFGVASKDFPQLYEAQTFNTDYDVYISAPYDTATIPVAYVTKDGIFAATDPVEYSSDVEKLVFGEADEDVVVPGITSLDSDKDYSIKIDARYPENSFGIPGVKNLPADREAIKYDSMNDVLDVWTGIPSSTEQLPSYEYHSHEAYEDYIEGGEEGEGYWVKDEQGNYARVTEEEDIIERRLKQKLYVLKEDVVLEEGVLPVAGQVDEVSENTIYLEDLIYYKYVADDGTYPVADPETDIIKKVLNSAATYYTRTREEVKSYINLFEDLIDPADTESSDSRLLGLEIDSDMQYPIFIRLQVQNGYVLTESGDEAEDPNGRYLEGIAEYNGVTLGPVEFDEDCIRVPLNHDLSVWFAERENLQTARAYWAKKVTDEDVVGVIFPKYPSERTLYIDFENFNKKRGYSSMTTYGRNILKFSAYEEGAFHDAAHKVSIVGSLDEFAKDANGGYLAFNDRNASYSEQDLVAVYSLGGFKKVTEDFTDLKGYGSIILKGGTRTAAENLSSGWEEAAKEEYSSVNIFFDSERHTAEDLGRLNDAPFFGLAKAHPLAGFIFNITAERPENITSQLSFGSNYWNICNEAIISLDNNMRIISPMTGVRAKMQVRIIENRWGGVAPMYLNSGTPSMGGQLDINPLRLRFRYTKDQQEVFDNLNMNPIILDHTYGVIVTGQKTCRSGELTDWSYIGHVSSFLEFEREVRENVMIPQLGKANNDYYRNLRKQQVENILNKRLSGTTRIWAAASVDTSTADGVNDIAARRARKFIINVKVKVDVFSETVELNFTNVDQAVEV